MALRSIENQIGNRNRHVRTKAQPSVPKTLALNTHGSGSDSDDSIAELQKLLNMPKSKSPDSKPLLLMKPKVESKKTNPKKLTKVSFIEKQGDEKENQKVLASSSNEEIVSSSRSASGSSIVITKRGKKRSNESAAEIEPINLHPLKQDPILKLFESDNEEPLENLSSRPKKFKDDKKVSQKPASKPKLLTTQVPIESSAQIQKKDFDFFLQNSLNETAATNKSVQNESVSTRPRRKVTETMRIYDQESNGEDLDDVNFEEEKSIRRKYKSRESKEASKLKLFGSDNENDDDYDDGESSTKKPKSRVSKKKSTKSPKSSSSRSKTNSRHQIDEDEVEKQLEEAAREFDEIKNYKLVVERVHHD